MQLKRNKEMEFETLKKSYKKQIIIGAIAICVIGGSLTFATTRAKYKLTQDIKLATGTVNYIPYDFKIMAMYQSEDGTNYTEIEEMPSSGYKINEEKSYCEMDDGTKVKGKIKTIDKQHTITNITKHDKCYIWFDREKTPSEETLAKLGIAVNTNTPDFSQAATTDNGVFKAEDGMYGGTSYYWRGAVTNNYVKFAGFCWRIVRINGDGSIRLIYDGSTCHANGTNTRESIAKTYIAYNSSVRNSSYVGWTYEEDAQRPTSTGGVASNAKTQVESWYNSNITGTNASKVADGKYCNDRNVKSGQAWVGTGGTGFQYAAYQRLLDNKIPTLSCPSGDVYILKAGLITADEVSYAGGILGANNASYYLYNGQFYWTMTPIYWSANNAYVFLVDSGGMIYYYNVNNSGLGLRPVINLRSDVTISSGDGSQSNPFVVS